ncbi:MAG: hypothetical protein J3K34DRAFT_525877 [Monoraphidium minutum]|nr:MAG: hypothetical protein J3K34DRAFT_525877 [Monoraphidium minutum]
MVLIMVHSSFMALLAAQLEALQAARADADAAAQEGGALHGKLIGALELLEKVHRVYTSRRTPEQPDPQFVLCDICNVGRSSACDG